MRFRRAAEAWPQRYGRFRHTGGFAHHAGGRKYGDDGEELPRSAEDPEKAESARIFKAKWDAIREDAAYQDAKG